jgi:hypothetical protein
VLDPEAKTQVADEAMEAAGNLLAQKLWDALQKRSRQGKSTSFFNKE